MPLNRFQKRILTLSPFVLLSFYLIYSCSSDYTISLSPKEIEYINNNKIEVLVGYQSPPNTYYNSDNEYVGLGVDYINEISKNLGIPLDKNYFRSWDNIIDYAKTHENFVIVGIARTADREKYLSFTESFIRMPYVILSKNKSGINSISDLKGKNICTVKSYAINDFLNENYAELIISEVENDYDGIKKVSNGEIDAIIINQMSASFLISEKGITNLHIGDEIGYSNKLCVAVSNKNKTLASVFDKSIDAIDTDRRKEIYSKWLNLTTHRLSQASRYYIIGIILIILTATLLAWFWLQTLKRQVLKKTEQFRISETKYRSLVENSHDAIFLQYRGKFLMINNKFSELFGYSKQQLLSGEIGIRDITAPESINYINDRLNLIKHNKPVALQYDITGLTKAKERVSLTLSVSYICHEDGYATQGIVHNITERIKKEQELRIAKERAEDSERLKSSFLANMSHEIRTPMNGILGFSQLLKNPEFSMEEKEQFIDIIQESGTRMLNTINDIIDISKIHVGQEKLNNSEVKICKEIKRLVEFFKPEAAKKDIKLNLLNECPKKIIVTDKTKLISILTNLIKNAINYSNDGEIQIKLSKENKQLNCWVRDTGIGIPQDRLDGVFDRFIQVDGDNSRPVQGSGLGLSITKSYVQMLGGNISVESEFGVGSVFYFYIPWEETVNCLVEG